MSTKINKSDMPCDEFINLVRDVKFTYMGKEKYYTPSIEEFFVGFEYEFYNQCWHDTICDANTDFIEIYSNKDRFRVKYLDSRDRKSVV